MSSTTTKFNLENFYKSIYLKENSSSAVSTLKTLMKFLDEDQSTTAIELTKNLKETINQLKLIDTKLEVESVAEIYFRFITLNAAKFDSFKALKEELTKRSQLYMKKVINCKKQLSQIAQKFITDDSVILVHSYSETVLETLKLAKNQDKNFTVYITESAPDYKGRDFFKELKKLNFTNIILILDSAIGYIMERIDLILVGCDGVTESGGIINKIGTYQMAICAKAHNKTFYCLAESYKFIRHYPLTQSDIPDRLKWGLNNSNNSSNQIITNETHPLVDYTPPNYITLLMTDLGPLTTAAVCDLLVQLYT